MTSKMNTSLKTLSLPLTLALMTALSGCATTLSPESRLAHDITQQSLKSQPVGIVSDACVLWVEMGSDDIRYQQSDTLSTSIANTLKDKLIEKNITISQVSSPFVCGAITQQELAKMNLIIDENAKEVLNTDYPILSSSNTHSEATNQAYLNLFKALITTRQASTKNIKIGRHTPLGLDTNSANEIRNAIKANKVFVILATANKQSFGLKLTVAATSQLVGDLINTAPGQFYIIHLVDLQTNQIEWSKRGDIELDVFKQPVTGKIPTVKMLNPLYPE